MSESQLVEYKESWRDEYLKWICASFACQNSFSKTRSGLRRFANAQGGVLYIGKRDDGSVCGVADSKKLMEDIPNKVRDALGLIVDVDLITENGLDVIKITVEENPYPVNYKGEYHYRTGSTKQLLQGSALTNFLLSKTGKNWDVVVPIFKFSKDVRKIIYTTNAIESLNSSYRKLNRQRSVFPSDQALLKALYLATFEATKKWTQPIHNWGQAYGEMCIMYEGRLPD